MKRTYHKTETFDLKEPGYETGPRILADTIAKNWPELCETSQTGLYIITEDSGFEASVVLWKQALQDSPRFVNPAPFPFTLSCSPAGYIAQQCKICGPNYTFIGPAAEFESALNELAFDLGQNIIDAGILIILINKIENDLIYFNAEISIYKN